MAVIGVHALIYTPEAEALRAVLTDAVGWSHVDARGRGGSSSPSLQPSSASTQATSRTTSSRSCATTFATTVAELTAKGISFRGEPEDRGWGVVTTMVLPGGVDVMLYEPRHPTALGRP